MSKKILVVDYERNSIDYIQETLRGEGYSLLTAYDGQQALQSYQSQVPDLVLTAALLPKLNGFELCKKITSGQVGEVRPVVMYSAIYKAEKYRKEAIFGCGAIDFLEKPIPKWQLMKVLQAAFSEIPLSARKEEELLTLPTEASGSVQQEHVPSVVPAATEVEEELLDVDTLFSSEPPMMDQGQSAVPSRSGSGAPVPVSLKSSLIAAIETEEIDAALDAFRIDLEKEINLREERRAQEIEEEELSLQEESILEFEAPQEQTPQPPQRASVSRPVDNFELDEISLDLQNPKDAIATHSSSISSNESLPERLAKDDNSVPKFGSTKPEGFGYWIPLTLLIVVLFFLFIVLR
ncbi:MAG: response regulator [Terriglobia bacterium]